MLLAVRISSYGYTWEVWRALKKLETVTHLSCSPNFPRASITRYTHAKHEQILKLRILKKNMARHGEIYDINCKIEKIEKEKILHRSSDSFKIGSWLWSFHLKLSQMVKTKKNDHRVEGANEVSS